MNTLIDLKQWLPIAEAAARLTALVGEPITEADLLQLALRGELTLSVRFANSAFGYLGTVVPLSDAKKNVLPAATLDGVDFLPLTVFEGVHLNDTEVLELDRTPVELANTIWDLDAVHGEARIALEQRYMDLTGGPDLEWTNLHGAILRDSDGRSCQLLRREPIESNNRRSWERTYRYFPAGIQGYDGAVMVLRSKELHSLHRRLTGVQAVDDSTLPAGTRWPNHETARLRALRLATIHWWSNYDPADPQTAPTNEQVAAWLRAEHGIAQSMAEAMASILRPDNLKPGPKPKT